MADQPLAVGGVSGPYPWETANGDDNSAYAVRLRAGHEAFWSLPRAATKNDASNDGVRAGLIVASRLSVRFTG